MSSSCLDVIVLSDLLHPVFYDFLNQYKVKFINKKNTQDTVES
jgi:hypothetical protein